MTGIVRLDKLQDNNDVGSASIASHSGKTSSSIKYQCGTGALDNEFDPVNVSIAIFR